MPVARPDACGEKVTDGVRCGQTSLRCWRCRMNQFKKQYEAVKNSFPTNSKLFNDAFAALAYSIRADFSLFSDCLPAAAFNFVTPQVLSGMLSGEKGEWEQLYAACALHALATGFFFAPETNKRVEFSHELVEQQLQLLETCTVKTTVNELRVALAKAKSNRALSPHVLAQLRAAVIYRWDELHAGELIIDPELPKRWGRVVLNGLPGSVIVGNDYHGCSVCPPWGKTKLRNESYHWVAYVRSRHGHVEELVHHVVFHLHPTFFPKIVTVTEPPFEVRRSGWGTFQLRIEIHFLPEFKLQHQLVQHTLTFDPAGSSTVYHCLSK
eukprot:TRINITY_DN3022_c0_g1_i3.p1 TRINITY_DN3022_c0_g1~~TRINITY_DN3022_c0_g1_i3.p1  ORF type:complete len:324 (-),score=57.52 TRINITY_DN3022_c0_g1_i3:56-1027(-)